jgi:hypothetical protein
LHKLHIKRILFAEKLQITIIQVIVEHIITIQYKRGCLVNHLCREQKPRKNENIHIRILMQRIASLQL